MIVFRIRNLQSRLSILNVHKRTVHKFVLWMVVVGGFFLCLSNVPSLEQRFLFLKMPLGGASGDIITSLWSGTSESRWEPVCFLCLCNGFITLFTIRKNVHYNCFFSRCLSMKLLEYMLACKQQTEPRSNEILTSSFIFHIGGDGCTILSPLYSASHTGCSGLRLPDHTREPGNSGRKHPVEGIRHL